MQGREKEANSACACHSPSDLRVRRLVTDLRDSKQGQPPISVFWSWTTIAYSAESLALLFELNGHEVKIAHDGPEGLRKLETFRPNLIVLDIGLPGMSGMKSPSRSARALSTATSPWPPLPVGDRMKTGGVPKKPGSIITWSSQSIGRICKNYWMVWLKSGEQNILRRFMPIRY